MIPVNVPRISQSRNQPPGRQIVDLVKKSMKIKTTLEFGSTKDYMVDAFYPDIMKTLRIA